MGTTGQLAASCPAEALAGAMPRFSVFLGCGNHRDLLGPSIGTFHVGPSGETIGKTTGKTVGKTIGKTS